MDEVLLDARDVVGGLWLGAVCRFEDEVQDWYGAYDTDSSDDQATVKDLVLPGPLGLGVAGLAYRVSKRLVLPFVAYDPMTVLGQIATEREHEIWWEPLVVAGDCIATLAAVSRYLASLDAAAEACGEDADE